MASVHGCKDLHVRVVSRRLVMDSNTSIEPHVLAVSNLDLLPQTIQVAMFCLYPKRWEASVRSDVLIISLSLEIRSKSVLPAKEKINVYHVKV